MGRQGPFGIIDKNNPEWLNYPILNIHKCVQPIQIDSCNCGVIWCLFIFDLMMQVPLPYTLDRVYKDGFISLSTKFGKTWTEPSIFNQLLQTQTLSCNMDNSKKQENYCQNLFQCFCDEIVVILEQLWLLRLQNNYLSKHIQIPDN